MRMILGLRSVILASFVFSGMNVWALDVEYAPSAFDKGGKHFEFIDLQTAHYEIEYNVQSKRTSVRSTLKFVLLKKGYPLFDLVPNGSKAWYQGNEVGVANIDFPSGRSKARYLNREFQLGVHQVVIDHELSTGVAFASGSVSSAFFMSDLSDRQFLERYLPASFDYDQVAMTFDVKVTGGSVANHTLQTNCEQTVKSSLHWQLVCPPSYNSSSLFYHLYKSDRFSELKEDFASIDGRSVQVTIYGTAPNSFMEPTRNIFHELEADYGPWPHDRLLIYAIPNYGGGMEYSGATATGMGALGHELHHSYFARSTFPMGGNAGWIDEALASWRDDRYRSLPKLSSNDQTEMAGHSEYKRTTDTDAYDSGARIIAHLDYLFQEQGGFKPFMKYFHAQYKDLGVTTQWFEEEITNFYSKDVSGLFSEYIYGEGLQDESRNSNKVKHAGFHSPLSEEDLKRLL